MKPIHWIIQFSDDHILAKWLFCILALPLFLVWLLLFGLGLTRRGR